MGTHNKHLAKVIPWYLLTAVFLLSLFLQFSQSEAVNLNVVGVNRNPAGTPAGTPPPPPTLVTAYYWTLEEDVMYPIVPGDSSTNWMSVSFHKSYMPIVASGCVSPTGGPTDPQCKVNKPLSDVTLNPNKRYFISVLPLQAGGYTNGGARIVASGNPLAFPATVDVYVNKLPLPMAQISVFVTEDAYPINGFPDPVTEKPLAGFRVFLIDAGGRYGISGGPDAYDVFGNPLGTTYTLNFNGTLFDDGSGSPQVVTMGLGYVPTDANGMAILKNLPPGKLSVLVLPPQGQEDRWSQTTTIEGTKVIDAWVKPNEPAYLVEFGPPMPHFFISFANTSFKDPAYFTGGATITGQVVNNHITRAPAVATNPGAPFRHTVPWLGLNDSATGKGIYVTRANADGTFSIPNIVPGTYQLVVWDDYCDIIINFSTVIVPNNSPIVDMGKIPVINWFARLEHRVFLDENADGFPDPDEPGIPLQTINLRWRDGSIYQSNVTGGTGWVAFNEIFPFFNWQIAEVDFLRYKATGVTVTVDDGGAINNPADPWTFGGQLTPQPQSENSNLPYRTESNWPSLLEGFQGFAGQTSVLQWGKKPYSPIENGGITGIIQYSVTRAEDDPTQGVAEPWEPGIPRVQVNLYRDCNADGIIDPPNCVPGVGPFGTPASFKLADVDNYPFQWTDPTYPGYTGAPGPEDIDRNGNGTLDYGDAIEVAWTDSWDDNLPTGCQGPPFTLSGTTTPADCFDGLLNWNQVRPAVFDGGYAFGTAATGNATSLPHGVYIVEAVPPPGYEIVREEDKNIDFGDNYLPQPAPDSVPTVPTGPAPGPINPFPPLGNPICVGDVHVVPAELSLFPGVPVVPALAGQQRRLCDRKLVVLANGENAAANFFFFTKAPVAGHITGMLTDDITNDPRSGSPNAGEKYAPPWLPISMQDWTGREIVRTYSDEWGRYNLLVPSTYTANTPLPSGMTPQMLTACLNSRMMPDPANPGVFIPDPWFNKYYGQFCYTLQYMPGTTTYLDTPVLPTSAYVGPTQFQLDCEVQDGTPVIKSVTGPGNVGPYVSGTGATITITSMGSEEVPNPAYNPATNPGVPNKITRDHGFGPTEGTVKIGNITISRLNVTWLPNTITAVIPTGTTTGQLTVIRGDNQKSTINGVTVTVGGNPPILVGPGKTHATIQAAIDAANAGDLITVAPGRYTELVIMWKPVRLQGWGAGSTTIDAVIAPFEKVEIWREKVLNHCRNLDFTLLPGQNPAQPECRADELLSVLGLGGAGANVLLESPGLIVLGKNVPQNQGGFGPGNSRLDGFTIFGSVNGGGIIVNGYAHNLEISNNRISNNMGVAAGGIRVGHTDLVAQTNPPTYQSAFNGNLNIHHNMITQNSGTARGAGGLMLGTGSDGYDVTDNWICGNITLSEGGGGIGHQGLSSNGLIAYNKIIFNEAWSNQATGKGGGIFIGGLPPLAPAVLTEGSGSVTVNANLIQGNGAGAGDGAGIAADQINGLDVVGNQTNWYFLNIFNNMIVNNVAGLAGGGIALQDVAGGHIIHNTIANNDSTATAAAAFILAGQPTQPQPAGIVSRAHSAALATQSGQIFSNPQLTNNIVWHNRSFHAVQDQTTLAWSLQPALNDPVLGISGGYWDLGVLGTTDPAKLNPTWSILTDTTNYGPFIQNRNKIVNNPNSLFVSQYFNYGPAGPAFEVPGVLDEGGNFLRVVFGPLTVSGNYHLKLLSPAENSATNLTNTYIDLRRDFDRDLRSLLRPDIGADERR